MMEKDNEGKWWLYQVDEPAEHGEHFLDILEPTVGDIIRRRIDNAPKHQRVTFQMKKGTAVDLPKNALKRTAMPWGPVGMKSWNCSAFNTLEIEMPTRT